MTETITGQVIPKPLEGKRLLFANEYLIDRNATQAAIRAGYSKESARARGSQLLTNEDIKAYIEQKTAELSKKTGADAEWLLSHLHAIATAKIGDIVDDDGNYKPISDWPDIWQMMVNGMDVQKISVGEAAQVMDKNSVLEKIGKHINVGAFKDTGTAGFSDEVMKAFFSRLPDTTGLPDKSLKTLSEGYD